MLFLFRTSYIVKMTSLQKHCTVRNIWQACAIYHIISYSDSDSDSDSDKRNEVVSILYFGF